jgi:hypothetical protein
MRANSEVRNGAGRMNGSFDKREQRNNIYSQNDSGMVYNQNV